MSRATKIVISVLVIFALIGLGFVVFTSQQGASEPTVSTPETTNETSTQNEESDTAADVNEENTVSYTDSGFTPSNLTVPAGTTVTFVNDSSRSMWVASDIHPTHTEYSGTSLQEHCANGSSDQNFDQCQSGETYSFTFEQAGNWGYHNHDGSHHTGTITVTAE